MNSNTNFSISENENINNSKKQNNNMETNIWDLILQYYKQVFLILLIFLIIYIIEHLNKHNAAQGAVSMIPGLMTPVASIIKKSGKKGKK